MPVGAWEWMWAPYDDPAYEFVLAQLQNNDIVLDIGAGDLRLSRQMAARVERVYALELNQPLLECSSSDLPGNLQIISGDARVVTFPEDITTAVLLMRHCTHFALYFDRLRAGSCRRLITNARWGMHVEIITLDAPRRSYRGLDLGWYACCCGNRGFKPGSPDALTETTAEVVWEVDSCPDCSGSQAFD